MRLNTTVFLAGLFFASICSAQEKTIHADIKYIDSNNDGMNDIFRDANGDGINDIDGLKYKHDFMFIDNNGDGVNDVFCDTNGDGINDIENKKSGAQNGQYHEFLDADGDGVNDVSGNVNEHASIFIDEDGDGINDNIQMREMKQLMKQRGKDVFIDSDGDGINDGRSISLEKRRGRSLEIINNKGGSDNSHGGKSNRGKK